jgi:hypothetical protein
MLDGGLSEFVLAKGLVASQRASPPQLVTAPSGHPVRANAVSISSILALAGGHQRVADLLVTDGKITLPPPDCGGWTPLEECGRLGVSYFAQTPLGPCAYNTFSIPPANGRNAHENQLGSRKTLSGPERIYRSHERRKRAGKKYTVIVSS